MSKWRLTTLGDVLRVEHGFAFKGEYFSTESGDVLLTPKNFRPSGGLEVSAHRCKYYTGPVEERYVLRGGDVVMAMTDLKQDAPILGSTGVVPARRRYLHNQRIGKIVISDPDRLDRRFAPWLLNAPFVRRAIRATATGATVRHTAPTRVAAIRVLLPNLALQARIAAVLSAFDELIEINERRIELLEDLARSLYREWFVHFRFPGHEGVTRIDSELGPIPVGWSTCAAADMFHINPKVTCRQESYLKVTMGDVSTRFSHVLPSAVTQRANGSKFRKGDVLLARITPCLENGKTALVLFLRDDEVGVGSTELIVLRGVDVGPAFVYCAARSSGLRDHLIGSMSGASGRQRVAVDSFKSLRMIRPPAETVERFEATVMPTLKSVMHCRKQNERLAATRDLLLPRLVTGKLDISDIDLGILTPVETE